MLKARLDHDTWMIQQHHHAQVSGYLAAHWGDANGFARPGHYPGATDPARWRDEVVLGIAEHDNGWWETEAMPRFNHRDGLPVGIGEAAPPTDANEFEGWRSGGFERWSIGIQRLAGLHPYSALLVSLHAYWLYAMAFEDLARDAEPMRHFVFGEPDIADGLTGERARTRAFLEQQADLQAQLTQRLADDAAMARAVEPAHLQPHLRLLQLMDSLSLYLALNDQDDHELPHVPRGGWDDRCTIRWMRRDARTIALDPYPFDVDPLPVLMPARIVTEAQRDAGSDSASPLARLHALPLRTIEFTLVSGEA
jgi:hypothetical protein